MKDLLHGQPRHPQGTRTTDNPGIRGARGLRIVLLTAFCLLFTINSIAFTNYVWQGSASPTAPYDTWSTAAHNIQEAVDAALPTNTVLVTNGYYNTGLGMYGGITNRVAITIPLKLKSVNGNVDTLIVGSNNIRTLFITKGVEIEGFTITGGYVYTSFGDELHDSGGNVMCWSGGVVKTSLIIGGFACVGGGNACCYYGGEIENCEITLGKSWNNGGGVNCYYSGIVRNCIVKNNYGGSGGGLYCSGGIVENCHVFDNKTNNDGGGANVKDNTLIRNCLVARNFARRDGGGIYVESSVLQNNTICSNKAVKTGGGLAGGNNTNVNNIVYYNLPDNYTNDFFVDVAMFNCSYPKIPGDNNSVTNEPNFIDYQNEDYRLLHDSPCFNAGTNEAWMIGIQDLSCQDRIIDGTVDIGAYEIGKLICEFNGNPLSGVVPLNINFNSIVSGTNTADVYFFWDFDNDGTYDTTGLWQDVTQFIYTNEGIYSVSLTVSNADSEIANNTIEGYVEVVPEGGMVLSILCSVFGIFICRRKFISSFQKN